MQRFLPVSGGCAVLCLWIRLMVGKGRIGIVSSSGYVDRGCGAGVLGLGLLADAV